MSEYTSLKILDCFAALFTRLGVNYKVMRRIVQVKLALDGRTVNVLTGGAPPQEGQEHSSFVKSMWIFVLVGLAPALIMLSEGSSFAVMTLYFGIVLFILLTSLVANFSGLLLEVRDRTILSTKPVTSRTISAAKLAHISIYLTILCTALAGPGLALGAYRFGFAFFGVMVVSLVLLCMLAVCVTSLLYTAVLRYFDGERLKDIIVMFQIFLMVGMNLGFQVFNRTIGLRGLAIHLEPAWWQIFVPPAYFGGLISFVVGGSRSMPYLLLSLMGFAVPLLAMWLHISVISPHIESYLAKLESSGSATRHRETMLTVLIRRVTRLLMRERVEGAFTRFSHALLTRERALKLQLYPQFAFGVALPLLAGLLPALGSEVTMAAQPDVLRGGMNVLYIYAFFIAPASMVRFIDYSESYRAAWVYKALPLTNPGRALRGAMQGFFLSYLLMPVLILIVLTLSLLGVASGKHLAVILTSSLLAMILGVCLGKKCMPFSANLGQEAGGDIMERLARIIILVVLAFIHWHLFAGGWLLLGYLVVLVLAVVFLWRTAFNFNWDGLML